MERICFQVEEAQWFYEDFIRPLDPSLPSLTLRAFSLRIFQHCPLFSEWSADNYTAAFAEFLAYKSRVPVRGAIMLNEDMDQVVLVKGWKKGANWSFPRGKINKDEDDMDCAVREVYEETGFDVRNAGLVQDAKDMKYIEITMREQHMRLYVFRGVAMDTHFEPRTRKEISKIEWYKLTDLPTLKKSKQQEGMGEQFASANKFYMVAPFLGPLKKWISQQRKRESRLSSQYYDTIPTVTEEILTDYGADISNGVDSRSNVPSDLPEVSQLQAPFVATSLHQPQLLDFRDALKTKHPLSTIPQVDTAKSNALLALLRNGSRPEYPDAFMPHNVSDQISSQLNTPRPAHHRYPRPPQDPTQQLRPRIPVSPVLSRPEAAVSVPTPIKSQIPPPSPFNPARANDLSAQEGGRHQAPAPYQRTGDPDFSHSHYVSSSGPRVPPASALPRLTSHAQSLLDVFNSGKSIPQPELAPPFSSVDMPLSTRTPPQNGQVSHTTVPAPALTDPSSLLPTLLANRLKVQTQEQKNPLQSTVDHRASLLGLFEQLPSPATEMAPLIPTQKVALAPVELAASCSPNLQQEQLAQKQLFRSLLQQKSSIPGETSSKVNKGSREGNTSATISGPLNQPQFDSIVRSSCQSSLTNDITRSPAPAHRTLFDPNQNIQKKILARHAGSDHSPARPSKPIKPTHTTSPKRPRSRKDDNVKLFQPQILRRPAADERDPSLHVAAQPAAQYKLDDLKAQPAVASSPALQPMSIRRRRPPPPDHHTFPPKSHKQTLLSLFSNPISPSPFTTPRSLYSAQPGRTSTSPAASGCAIVSPLTEKPISTRSRLGSLASIVSTGSGTRPAAVMGEKRQTAASDKAFLLGYLGRIASQEG